VRADQFGQCRAHTPRRAATPTRPEPRRPHRQERGRSRLPWRRQPQRAPTGEVEVRRGPARQPSPPVQRDHLHPEPTTSQDVPLRGSAHLHHRALRRRRGFAGAFIRSELRLPVDPALRRSADLSPPGARR
jgi:hypothetical protein